MVPHTSGPIATRVLTVFFSIFALPCFRARTLFVILVGFKMQWGCGSILPSSAEAISTWCS